jgi:hypothetical protein
VIHGVKLVMGVGHCFVDKYSTWNGFDYDPGLQKEMAPIS